MGTRWSVLSLAIVSLIFTLHVGCPQPVFAEDEPISRVEIAEVGETTTDIEEAKASGLAEPDSTPLRFYKTGSDTYVLPDAPLTQEQRDSLGKMTPQEVATFNERRIGFMKLAASLLHRSRYGIRGGVVVAAKVAELIPSGQTLRHPIQAFRNRFFPKEDTAGNPSDPTEAKRGFKQLSHDMVQQYLHALNNALFNRASLVMRANEFGLNGAIVLQAGAISSDGKGFYDNYNLGFELNYNHTDKALVFSLDVAREKTTRMLPLGKIGAFLQARGALQASYVEPQDKGEVRTGYQVQLPGHVYFSDSEKRISGGIEWGPGFSVPPVLSHESAYKRATLLRVEVSPFTWGFLRTQGVLVQPMNWAAGGVAAATRYILKKGAAVASSSRLRCWASWTGLKQGASESGTSK